MPTGKEIFANKSANGLDNVNADYVDVLHDLTVHGNTVLDGTITGGIVTAPSMTTTNLTATDAEILDDLTVDSDTLIKGNLTVWGSTTDTGAVNVTDSIDGYLNGEQVHNTNSGTSAAAAFKAYNDTNDQAFFGMTSSGNTGVHGSKRAFVEGPGVDISTTGGASKTVRFTTNDINRVEIGDTEITSHVPITIPADPITDSQVANKNYVDDTVAGLNAISALTGDVTATGPGSVAATVQAIQGTTVTITTPSTDQILSHNGTAFVNQSTNGTGNVVRTTSATLVTPNIGGATADTLQVNNLTPSLPVFSNAGKALISNAMTGTGNVVMSNTPTLVTPHLGTPIDGDLSNCTGTASGLTSGNVTNSSVDFAGTPFTANGAIIASDTNTITSTLAGTEGQSLIVNSSGVPTFQFSGAALPDFANFSTTSSVTFTTSPANATIGANYKSTVPYSFYLETDPGLFNNAVYASQDTYTFILSPSGSAVIGSVYSNNGNQFIVVATVSASASIIMYGLGFAFPLSNGTLTRVSGNGDATLDFSSQSITTPGHNYVVGTYDTILNILYATSAYDPIYPNGILNRISGTGDQTITYDGWTRPDLFYFEVSSTIVGGTSLVTLGSGVPLDAGYLVKDSGTGDDVITYSARTIVATQLTASSPTTIYSSVTKQFNLPDATTLQPGRSFIFAGAFNVVFGNNADVSIYSYGDTVYLVPLYKFSNTTDALFRATLLTNTTSTGKWAFTYEAAGSRGPVAYDFDLDTVATALDAAKKVYDIYNSQNDATLLATITQVASAASSIVSIFSILNTPSLLTNTVVLWDGSKYISLDGTEDGSLLTYKSSPDAPQYGGKAVITDSTSTDVILGVSNNFAGTCDGLVVKAPALTVGSSVSSYFGTGISPGNCLELYYEHHGDAVVGNLARLNMGSSSFTIGSSNFTLESTDASSSTLNVVNDAVDATVFTSGEFATGVSSGGSALKQFGKDGLVGNNVTHVFNWNGNNSTSNFYRVILDNSAKFQLNNTTVPTTESVGQHTITATGASSLTVVNSTTTGVSLGDFFAPSVGDGFTYASFLRVGKNSTTGNNGTLSYVHTASTSPSNYTQLAHNLSKINLFNTVIPSIEMIGSTTIAQADAATDSLIVYNNSSGTTIENAVFMNPNLPGGVANIRIGVNANTNNHGKIVFTYGSSGSVANSLSTEMGLSRIEQFASGANTITGPVTINNTTGSIDSLVVTNQETSAIDIEMSSMMAPNINNAHVITNKLGRNLGANNYVTQAFQYVTTNSPSNAFYTLIGSSEILLEASGVHTYSGTGFNALNNALATLGTVNLKVGKNAGALNAANYGYVHQAGDGNGYNHALLGVSGYECLRLSALAGVSPSGAQVMGDFNTGSLYTSIATNSTSKYTGGVIVKSRYTFTITAATVVFGDVYTNNGQFFYAIATSAGTTMVTSGINDPVTAPGVLTKVQGTGAATINYSAYVVDEGGLAVQGPVYANHINAANDDGGGAPLVATFYARALTTGDTGTMRFGKGTSGLNDDYAIFAYNVASVSNSIMSITNGNSSIGFGRTSGSYLSSIPSSGLTAFTVNNSIASAENVYVLDTMAPSLQTGFNNVKQFGKNVTTGNKVTENFFYNGSGDVGNYYRIAMDNGAEIILNNAVIPQVATLGQLSATNSVQTTPTLKASNLNSSAGDIEVAEFTASNLVDGNFVNFKFGKNTSTGNHGDIEFFSNGNNDAANRFTFGLGSAGLAVNNAGENALAGKTTVTASGTSALVVNNNATGVVDVGEFYQPNMVVSDASSILLGKDNTSGNHTQLSFTYNADSTNHAALTCGSSDFTLSSGGLSVLTSSLLSTTAQINQVTANLGTGTHTLASFFNPGSVPVTNKLQVGFNIGLNACTELAHYADNIDPANDYSTLGIVGLTPAIKINPTTLKLQQPVDFPDASYTANGVAYASTTTRLASTGTGTSGQVLTSNGSGSPPTFQTVTGTGTVTSVAMSVPSFLSVSGSPITTSGTLAVTATTTPTGTGAIVLATSPTIVTPAITTSTATTNSVATFYAASLNTSAQTSATVGVNSSALNNANYGFFYVGNGSGSNYALLGINGYESLQLFPKTGVAVTGGKLTGEFEVTGRITCGNLSPTQQIFSNHNITFVGTNISATIGAVYQDGYLNNFTVNSTVSSASAVTVTPFVTNTNAYLQAGTLTKTSGTGDASISYTSYSYSAKSGTYTTPANVKYIKITLVGGGGGGSVPQGILSTNSGGAGGSGGGAVKHIITSPSSTYSYSVGIGGVGATIATTSGGAGGNTTFSTVTANGGPGGFTTTIYTRGSSGVGGSGNNLETLFSSAGGTGNSAPGGFPAGPGVGGNSGYGGGGGYAGNATLVVTGLGMGYGGGGSGGYMQGATLQFPAADGAPGAVIVDEYYI